MPLSILGADARRLVTFLHNGAEVGLGDRRIDGFFVQRRNGARVDHFHRDALFRQDLRRLQGPGNHEAHGDQRDVGAFPLHVCQTDRNGIVTLEDLLIDFLLLLVEELRLTEQNRIITADR